MIHPHPASPVPHAQSKAFTLVELLVVIGIIALLISILLPALNKARDAANTLACLSNCRVLGQAFVMYTGEHKGWMPLPTAALDIDQNGVGDLENDTWISAIDPYLGAKGDPRRNQKKKPGYRAFVAIKQDPIWNTFPDEGATVNVAGTIKESSFTLKMNTHLRRGSSSLCKITDVKEPASFVLLGDSTAYDVVPIAGSGDLSHLSFQISETNNKNDAYPYMRHRKNTACNIAFVDGHAETVILALAPPGLAPDGITSLDWSGTANPTTFIPKNYQIWYSEYCDASGKPIWPNNAMDYGQALPAGWYRNPQMPLHWSLPPKLVRKGP
ncbi:MAG TPA: prepilin-type N-terminal cleavage/methylation domain-containing protein [Tepidisphaeraceae bacterium]|jgi:prepilin-type N-terminal cleavage/methylation domain-containing protein/prepilin-type processing-associated H-X9-DG protein|nr:prepilin-type N-terminal cleavage/methylation domain-containing protein [Tepidisphaeraceae bacterium]